MKCKLEKYICCSISTTTAARIIGFIGLLMSVALMTFLLKDHQNDDFHMSRNLINILGLDWSYMHVNASTKLEEDPSGKITSITVIVYATLFLVANMMLMFATVLELPLLAFPWMLFEFLNCVAKIVALSVHFASGDQINSAFITGCTVYIVLTVWWWSVVYHAQNLWNISRNMRQQLIRTDDTTFTMKQFDQISSSTYSMKVDSPLPYMPNEQITQI